jgi:hypothetical protein
MIEKILTASTGNITKEDAEKLKTEDQFFVGNFEFGFIMFVVPMLGLYAGYSEAFHKIIEIASEQDCLCICFDCDAEPLPGFSSFNW